MRQVILPLFAAALFAAVFVFQARTPQATIAAAPNVTLPEKIAGFESDAVAICQEEKCSRMFARAQLAGKDACPACGGKLDDVALGEKRILPRDTRIQKRLYTAADGVTHLVSCVIGGTSKSSIHRPELCLPSQGYLMRAPETRDVAGRPWRIVRLTAPHGGDSGALAYTFFNQTDFRTASHTARIFRDTWDRSVFNRVDRWVMVTVSTSEAGNGFDRLLAALSACLDTEVASAAARRGDVP